MQDSTDATTARLAFTAGLRAFADWFDEHPEFEVPYEATPTSSRTFSHGALDSREQFATLTRALGGHRDKEVDDSYYRVWRDFGGGVRFEVWALRNEVCEAVVVGTETVIEDEIIEPAVTRRVERQRDKIEWRCAPVLAERDQIGAMS